MCLLPYNVAFEKQTQKPMKSILNEERELGYWRTNIDYSFVASAFVATSLSKTAASSSCFRFDKSSFVPPQIPLGFFHFEDDSPHRVAWRSHLSIAAKAIFTTNFRRDGSIKLKYIYNVKKSIRQGVKCYLKSNFLTAASKIFWDVHADRYFGIGCKKWL